MSTVNRHSIQLAVVGDSHCGPAMARLAEDVGRAIARAGAILVCGGLGGVMEAAARGAKEEGGFTLGVLPGTARGEANDYIDCCIATGLGHFRNFLIAQTADALIAVAGQYGTLSEMAMALTMGKPVVGLETWDVEGVQPARTPEEAVEKALGSVRSATK